MKFTFLAPAPVWLFRILSILLVIVGITVIFKNPHLKLALSDIPIVFPVIFSFIRNKFSFYAGALFSALLFFFLAYIPFIPIELSEKHAWADYAGFSLLSILPLWLFMSFTFGRPTRKYFGFLTPLKAEQDMKSTFLAPGPVWVFRFLAIPFIILGISVLFEDPNIKPTLFVIALLFPFALSFFRSKFSYYAGALYLALGFLYGTYLSLLSIERPGKHEWTAYVGHSIFSLLLLWLFISYAFGNSTRRFFRFPTSQKAEHDIPANP